MARQQEADTRSGFRKDIQALRAVAVVLVVLFHLWPKWIPGGYIGVDVFFVVSGYLITAHLLREATETGRVNVFRFWSRRIRRLLPAASIVLIASLAATVLLLPVSLWQRTVTEIGASAAYFQNWVLASSAVDYLAADDEPTLVQHFWSLSVEEQFYIAWPLLVLLVLLVRGRWRPDGAVAALLGTVGVVSLCYSVVMTASYPSFAYFDTGTRAWEFASGGLLAWGVARGLGSNWSGARSWVLSIAGLAIIAASALILTSAAPYPGWLAIFPVVGALLVLVPRSAGEPRWMTRLTGLAPVQRVGDYSYAIYLWHWPLIVVIPFVTGQPLEWPTKLGVLVLCFVLAWGSTRLIEDPVRSRMFVKPRQSVVLAMVTMTALVGASAVVWSGVQVANEASARTVVDQLRGDPCFGAGAMLNECSHPFAVPAHLNVAFAAADTGVVNAEEEVCPEPRDSAASCDYSRAGADGAIAVVGNSHAAALIPAIDLYAQAAGMSAILYRRTDCLAINTIVVDQPTDPKCTRWTRAVLEELVKRDDIEMVVFAVHRNADQYVGSGTYDSDERRALLSEIEKNFRSIAESGKTVVVFGDVPGSRPINTPDCVAQNRDSYDPCAEEVEDISTVMDEAARDSEFVDYIPLRPLFCDDRCHVVIGGVVVYFDDHHLTGTFSRSLAPFIGEALQEARHAHSPRG